MRLYTLFADATPGFAYGQHMCRQDASGNWARVYFDLDPYPSEPIGTIVERGSKYADMMENTAFLPVFRVEVLDAFRAAGIGPFPEYPFEIVRASKKLRELGAPEYRHIRVDGRVELDLKAMRVRWERDRTGKLAPTDAKDGLRFLIKPGTWDGSDLCRAPHYQNIIFCTERVWRLAREHQWTNMRFEVPEDISRTGLHPRVVEYRAKRGILPPPPDEQTPLDEFARAYYAKHGRI